MFRRLGRIPWKRVLRPTVRDAAWLLVVIAAAFRGELSRLLPHAIADGSVETGRQLDVQIVGRGYFTAKHQATGLTAFFRHGHLQVNNCGQLSVGRLIDGWTVDPPITIPDATQSIEIAEDGAVRCRVSGEAEPKQVGRLELATFINDEGLSEIVSGLFVETWESGCVTCLAPGSGGRAVLKQGRLENSSPAPSSNFAQRTNRDLDLRVRGRGRLMAVQWSTEATAFFRPGRLNLDSNGQLCIGTGDDRWIVQPAITIPMDAQQIEIGHDGTIMYRQSGNPQPTSSGQLTLVTFVNEDGLRPVGDGGLAETLESGAANMVLAGQQGTGFFEQGWLDPSPASPSGNSWSLKTPAVPAQVENTKSAPGGMVIAAIAVAARQVDLVNRRRETIPRIVSGGGWYGTATYELMRDRPGILWATARQVLGDQPIYVIGLHKSMADEFGEMERLFPEADIGIDITDEIPVASPPLPDPRP